MNPSLVSVQLYLFLSRSTPLPHHCFSVSVLDTPISLFRDSALYTSQTHHFDSGSSIPYASPASHTNTLINPFQSVIHAGSTSPVCHTHKRKPVCLRLDPSDTH